MSDNYTSELSHNIRPGRVKSIGLSDINRENENSENIYCCK
jgi:hypothetical protein